MRKTLFAILLALPFGTSCAALVAGTAAGIVISKEATDNHSYVSRVDADVHAVWALVKTTMSDTSTTLIEVDEGLRTAVGKIDGADVKVSVEAFDIDKTTVRVHALRYYMNDGDTAAWVMDKLMTRLEQ